MENKKVYTAIGLMSGTSLDGVDAALIETDGYGYVKPLGFVSEKYDEQLREAIRGVLGKGRDDEGVAEVERAVTNVHVEIVNKLFANTKRIASKIDVCGFHGQTIFHNPKKGVTVQLGDGGVLAGEIGIDVVNDFRSSDVAAGGQGAPFLPLYHRARIQAEDLPMPIAVLNIGGVGNVTWINGDEILAFDTGPGNALLDDFIKERTGLNFDEGGKIAQQGAVDEGLIREWMSNPYFSRPVPKSLDRDEWGDVVEAVGVLSTEDGAATLSYFTVQSIREAIKFFPQAPQVWLVTGGGRHNHHIIHGLRNYLGAPVRPVEDYDWNGDAIEAEGFAYLAVRSLLGEPLSLPSTTGVPKPMTGGKLHKAA